MREYMHLFRELPFQLLSLDDLGIDAEVEETGQTFLENAWLKANSYASLSGMLTLSDDSGLEVDALGGEPGPRSARYAGEGASPEERNRFLLAKMEAVPDGRRQARFRCVIALAAPGLAARTAEGTLEGVIAREPRGASGFGYDPIFDLPELGKRLAELSMEQKNEISHRGKAMASARAIIEELLRRS
ncbi:MAG: RdgB/HAM1 family non-canonical purine NTP pyrophosphatase [Chloroflexi bacterium]|nr:RdgB/HAM1 family non-canonical purine NTP pyrophosphatase [Chloroflexota bacterium]